MCAKIFLLWLVVAREAVFVPIFFRNCLGWPHGPPGPPIRLPNLEDHGHAVLHMPVDVAMDNPGSPVVNWGPEDDISVDGHLDDILENWPMDFPW